MIQGKNIESAGSRRTMFGTLKVALCGPDDAILLRLGHAFCAAAKMRAPAIADFGKHETVSMLHDQVDFPQPAMEIAGYGLQPAGMQK
jgi:hypothetical protein